MPRGGKWRGPSGSEKLDYRRYIRWQFSQQTGKLDDLRAAGGEIIVKSPLTKSPTSSPRAKFLCKSDEASSNVKLNQADPTPMEDSV